MGLLFLLWWMSFVATIDRVEAALMLFELFLCDILDSTNGYHFHCLKKVVSVGLILIQFIFVNDRTSLLLVLRVILVVHLRAIAIPFAILRLILAHAAAIISFSHVPVTRNLVFQRLDLRLQRQVAPLQVLDILVLCLHSSYMHINMTLSCTT